MPFGVQYLDTPARFELTLLSPEAFNGAAFGILMFLNVWFVIWPNQKVVIASAVTAAGGGQANPKAAAAARRAFLASRTNTVMSFPMLFFMGAASHFTLNPARNAGLWGVVLLVILALLELNAVVGPATT